MIAMYMYVYIFLYMYHIICMYIYMYHIIYTHIEEPLTDPGSFGEPDMVTVAMLSFS